MSRLIDADNLNFRNQIYNKSQMKAILDFVDAQPTVEVNQWIACSERLPKQGDTVLTCDINGWICVDIVEGETKEHLERGYFLAWQPLPAPYKPNEEEPTP